MALSSLVGVHILCSDLELMIYNRAFIYLACCRVLYRLADQDEPVGVEENHSSLFYLLTAGSESSCRDEIDFDDTNVWQQSFIVLSLFSVNMLY